MLQNIREGIQGWLAWVIVIIICIPFALWGIQEYISPTPKSLVAEVNGVELTERDYQDRVRQRKQQLRAMFQDQNIDLSFMDAQIKKNVLEQMIEEQVLLQSAQDAGMRIGDNLLVRRIHDIPAFQENDSFSQARYEQLLSYQGMTKQQFEIQMRDATLLEQLRLGVTNSAFITDYDKQQRARVEKQERLLSYVIIPANRFKAEVEITEEDINTYYKDNAARYMTDEKVSVEYVEFSQQDLADTDSSKINEESIKQRYEETKDKFKTPIKWKARHILIEAGSDATDEELKEAEKQAQDLLVKINAGESFEDLAKKFSDDFGSRKTGGDLGWFGPKTMVQPFEDAVKSMKIGDVSTAPVKTQFGFHIIKLEDIKPEVVRPFEEVREQLLTELKKERAETAFYGQAEQFANLAFENPNSLEVLTKTLNLKSKTTELFSNKGSQDKDSILSNPKVVRAAFSDAVLKDGYNSDVIQIDEQHIVVLRLKDHEPAKAKPIEDVKDDIVAALTKERIEEKAASLGDKLLKQIKDKKADIDNILKDYEDLNWSAAIWAARDDTSIPQAIVSEAFKLGRTTDDTAIYEGISLDNEDYALIALLDVKDGKDDAEVDVKKQEEAIGDNEFQQFVASLKAKAEIKEIQK
jgi:peptidyl-prolyl cis-trans isomerase D